ncbi:MAG: phenylalanine--tRNA ligase subunit beta [Hyphomicrobiales bacterium]|nr:phenylalanine--tRNA ligase subunit beta [Hyphomicrobiales bacterium]
MKLTLPWLAAHLETSAPLASIAETLTRIGLEVEAIDNAGDRLKGFIVAHVLEARPHPNADRLRVCMVDTGAGAPVQVVCGAPNARAGMSSVFAPAGTYIPGKNITLGQGVIRGVESNGMLCSAAELELSNDHDGIIELPAGATPGMAYAAFAGLDNPVLDINLTPNRPDAAGVHGIARDLAAAGLGTLKPANLAPVPGHFACPVPVSLDLPAHLCPKFALRLVRGVKNAASPAWLQDRLKSIGLRPINALVDITNFMTFDQGRPLHVFDADKVRGGLVIREARSGETIVALDGRSYELEAGMVVIADDAGVESIAGIMGGEASGCDAQTTNVLIESALWDATDIARTGRKLGITSDARYRFERGVDPAFCEPGAEMATRMVLDLCGGEASELAVHVPQGYSAPAPRSLSFPFAETARLTGVSVAPDEAGTILGALGFGVARKGDAQEALVTVPSWRPDIEGKADLVEEIIRIAGIDRVHATALPRLEAGVARPVLTPLQKRRQTAQRSLAGLGFIEAVTWSFISQRHARAFGGGAPALALANPIAADLSDMRPSLLPGLIAAAARNADKGLGDVALCEIGQVFLGSGDKDQRLNAAALRKGDAGPQGAGRHWSQRAVKVSFDDARRDCATLLAALGLPVQNLQFVRGAPSWYHPGRSATIQMGPKLVLGHVGELHPSVNEAFAIDGPLVGFELTLDALPAPKARATRARPRLDMPDLMALRRDFAFVIDREQAAGDVIKAAQGVDKNLVTKVTLFDMYEGPGLPEGKKSVAIEVVLQPREKTLNDAEIEAFSRSLIAEVARKTGATLRG